MACPIDTNTHLISLLGFFWCHFLNFQGTTVAGEIEWLSPYYHCCKIISSCLSALSGITEISVGWRAAYKSGSVLTGPDHQLLRGGIAVLSSESFCSLVLLCDRISVFLLIKFSSYTGYLNFINNWVSVWLNAWSFFLVHFQFLQNSF